MKPFGQLLTPGGYLMEEAASALQKSIRRGLADDALFWAVEIDRAGYGEYLWKRLRIISSEDIGSAAPQICVELRALYENWRDLRKKEDTHHAPERLFLVDAVLRLARAPKSREVDHALIVHYEGARERRPVPDYALDKHTARGRRLSRGHRHFFSEGARLVPAAPADDYAERAERIRSDNTLHLE